MSEHDLVPQFSLEDPSIIEAVSAYAASAPDMAVLEEGALRAFRDAQDLSGPSRLDRELTSYME